MELNTKCLTHRFTTVCHYDCTTNDSDYQPKAGILSVVKHYQTRSLFAFLYIVSCVKQGD